MKKILFVLLIQLFLIIIGALLYPYFIRPNYKIQKCSSAYACKINEKDKTKYNCKYTNGKNEEEIIQCPVNEEK